MWALHRLWLVVWISFLSLASGCAWLRAVPGDELLGKNCEGKEVEPVPVGVLLPLSGKYQWYGQAVLSGVRLAAEEGSGAMRLVVRDTAGDPAQAVQELEDLVESQRVAAVIGPMFTDVAQAAAERAQQLQVPILVLNGHPDIARSGSYVFRNFLTREAQVELLVRYATETLQVHTFAVVHPQDAYGESFLKLFQAEVDRKGGQLVRVQDYPPEATDLTVPVKQLVQRYELDKREDFVQQRDRIKWKYRNNPLQRERAFKKLVKELAPVVDFEAVFLPDVHEKAAMFGPALAFVDVILHTEDPEKLKRIRKSLGRRKLDLVYLLGTEGWNHPDLVRWAGRYLQGAIFTDGFFAGSQQQATRRFVQAYRARNQDDPERLSAHGYDCALILQALFDQGPPCSTEELRDALLRIEGFEGATGKTSFGPDGDAHKELFLLTVQGGAIVELDKPPPIS